MLKQVIDLKAGCAESSNAMPLMPQSSGIIQPRSNPSAESPLFLVPLLFKIRPSSIVMQTKK